VSWVAVAATLKVQFAKTITLSLSIADGLEKIADYIIAPTLVHVVPKEYSKWIPIMIGWTCKSIGMTIAWYIQRVISAFTSAIRGGLMAARALIKFMYRRGIRLGGFIAENDEDTYIDEVLGFTLAGLGFYFQYKLGFHVPFPLNLVLLPFEVAESWIQWTITSSSD
jgi:hypothetical protein